MELTQEEIEIWTKKYGAGYRAFPEHGEGECTVCDFLRKLSREELYGKEEHREDRKDHA